jgi:Uma2 family endonuclease
MASLPLSLLTPDEYLALEYTSEFKSQYLSGELFATAGASRAHLLIVTNLVREISTRLRGRPCETYAADMRARTSPAGLYTYPDVVVVCGEPEFAAMPGETLLNPTLLVEVLSPSTEKFDRGQKFARYRDLPTLLEYVLVSQDEARVEKFVRQPDGQWLYSSVEGLECSVVLTSAGGDLPLSFVYERVVFARETKDSKAVIDGG